MTEALALLAAAVLLFAAFLVAHVALLVTIVRSEVRRHWKWLALVPPLTPVAGWLAKKRAATLTWVVLLVGYGALRLVAG